ncbi:retention module-containing protein, partial [Balneatrix alpica]
MAAVGRVTTLIGQVTAKGADGQERVLALGDVINSGDMLQTGEGATVVVQFDDGTRLDLGSNDIALIDSSVYQGIPPAADITDATADVDAIQAAILAGVDPTAIAEATAAGNAPAAGQANPDGGGGISSVSIQRLGLEGEPNAGFDTTNQQQNSGSSAEDTIDIISTVDMSGPATVREDIGSVEYTLTLDQANPRDITVTIAIGLEGDTALRGSDYGSSVSFVTVVIPAGSLTATFTLPILDDALVENGEFFTVSIVDVSTGGQAGVSQVATTITDDVAPGTGVQPGAEDTVTFTLEGPAEVIESDLTAAYTVKLSQPVPEGKEVVVSFSYSGTAIDGADFTGVASIVIPGGQQEASFNIQTLDDAFVELNDQFVVAISSIDASTVFENTAVVGEPVTTRIIDDVPLRTPGAEDTVSIDFSGPASVIEGEVTSNYKIELSQAVPANGQAVTLELEYSGKAQDGVDFTGVKTVVIQPGSSSVEFSIATIDDPYVENAESFTVTLKSSSLSSVFENVAVINDSVVTQIVDDVPGTPPGVEDTVFVDIAGVSTLTEGQSGNYTISLSHAVPTDSAPITVNLRYFGTATDGQDYNGIGSITIQPGQAGQIFTIQTLNDSIKELPEQFTIEITSVNASATFENVSIRTPQVTTQILDDDESGVTVSQALDPNGSTIQEGEYAIFTVNVSGAATGSTLKLALPGT